MTMLHHVLPRVTCAVSRIDEPDDQVVAGTHGLWQLNSGAAMHLTLWGINHDLDDYPQTIRLVCDWASARFSGSAIPCFWNHWDDDPVGHWTDLAIDAAAGTARGRLHLLQLDDPDASELFRVAKKARVMIDSGMPLEASIGSDPRIDILDLEPIAPGETVDVNGRTFQGSAELPLYIWRNAVIAEASLCMHGRDGDTGLVAASTDSPTPGDVSSPGRYLSSTRPDRIRCAITDSNHKEHDMSDKTKERLGRLLAAHDPKHHSRIAAAVAADKPDEEIEGEISAAETEEQAEALATANARIAELETQITQLQADLAAANEAKAPESATEESVTASVKTHKVTASVTDDGEGDPKTYAEAVQRLTSDGVKASAFAMRREVGKRWPSLIQGQVK